MMKVTNDTISSFESKLIEFNGLSILPLEEHHGGIIEQFARFIRKDEIPVIQLTVQKDIKGDMQMTMVEKDTLAEAQLDENGKPADRRTTLINGITEIKTKADRNAIMKNMSVEDRIRYENGETVTTTLLYNPSRGMFADLLESFAGKVFDGSASSLWLSTGVSRGASITIASGDGITINDLGLYSQGNIVGLGAFNVLKNNGIRLDDTEVRSYGTPIRRSTLKGFEDELGITYIGGAINMADGVGNKSAGYFGLSGEGRMISLETYDTIRRNHIGDYLGDAPFLIKASLRQEIMPGLYVPLSPDSDKIGKRNYKNSIVLTDKEREQIIERYNREKEISTKDLNRLISYPHGNYVYESAKISEKLVNKFIEYSKASVEDQARIKVEIENLYNQDQRNKIDMLLSGPPLHEKNDKLIQVVRDYNWLKAQEMYNSGRFSDRVQGVGYVSADVRSKLENTSNVASITEYLTNLRKRVGTR